MTIDREWDVPVYQQLAGILREQIQSGELAPRRPIPSARTLVERYGIARATATKAVQVLVVPGRGWFVAPRGG
jgi:DNA-binding GntR family transcriptional regulator